MLTPWITQEVRWFSPGEILEPVHQWFDHLGEKNIQPARTDVYLAGMDESVGVKLREGRLEVKHRTEDHGVCEFASGVSGRAESWIKWGFEISEADWPGVESGLWVPVRKARQFQFYSIREDGEVIQPVPGELPMLGGVVELCSITSPSGQEWWTVGLEVFGPPEKLSDLFDRLGVLIFEEAGWFNTLESLSYPAWLVKVC
jgi:hypothetical protein